MKWPHKVIFKHSQCLFVHVVLFDYTLKVLLLRIRSSRARADKYIYMYGCICVYGCIYVYVCIVNTNRARRGQSVCNRHRSHHVRIKLYVKCLIKRSSLQLLIP